MPAFPTSEYENRLKRAQAQMTLKGFDAVLLTSEVEFTYFSGFYTQFGKVRRVLGSYYCQGKAHLSRLFHQLEKP